MPDVVLFKQEINYIDMIESLLIATVSDDSKHLHNFKAKKRKIPYQPFAKILSLNDTPEKIKCLNQQDLFLICKCFLCKKQ